MENCMDNFKIVCLKCGSEDIDIEEDMDWAWDGEEEYPVSNGYYIICKKCGNSDHIC